jgi:hypothetical protein
MRRHPAARRRAARQTGCDWRNVVRVSFFLDRNHEPDDLLKTVVALAPVPLRHAEIELVEGFSRPGKLVEIEITAKRRAPIIQWRIVRAPILVVTTIGALV